MKSLIEQLKELRDAAEKRMSRHSSYDEGKVAAYNAAIAIVEDRKVDGKRIAELTESMLVIQGGVEAAARRIRDLQSQLAWTLVSAGLPTEPGFYLFVNPDSGPSLYERVNSDQHPWRSSSGVRRRSDAMVLLYKKFRRIELPEAS